ncbi:MAG: flagellar assembly protein FliX [Alphaproteobacteria bacterium]|nr:flagellar assembly protein FliX [Alphaproteobacteria bacterium]
MIDKIDGLGSIRTPQPIKRTSKSGATGNAGFARHLDEEGEAAALAGIGSTNPVGGILGVQEVEDTLSRAARGKKRAEDILDKLEDLRLQLLAGTLTHGQLQQLSHLVTARRAHVNDPKLAAILDEIDLRAQVELAKYGP